MWPTHVLHTVPGLRVFWVRYSVCRELAWSVTKGPSHWTTHQRLWAAEAKHKHPEHHTDKSHTNNVPAYTYFTIPCKPRGAMAPKASELRAEARSEHIITPMHALLGPLMWPWMWPLIKWACKKVWTKARPLMWPLIFGGVTLNLV